ncbi:MAG: elongation factor P [Candidatus Magasanikbacteria bacterium]|nr:elongation factor P [Candidatus Magasanikbacteria bacterium]MCA9389095.1 elongation factor P [Candidatus Magasanikbacteria bacterium]MCA9391231.1 elongation factor P [Candidatus Magasanikbacteria bacterium]USN52459.1 MAG: elongation factor P [Candidatus Nomurabacteria bacterium]HPF95051.1 elongation factor P [bacterium]
MGSPNDIKKGVVIRDPQGIWLVVEFQHVNPGKGAAFVRTRIKNLQSGKMLETTYKTSETIELVAVERRDMNFLYSDASGYTFMDNETFEQVTMPADEMGDDAKYLSEGLKVNITMFEGRPLAVEVPRKMTFKVTESMDAVAGNTASGGNLTKEVTLEGGIKIRVPLFIKQGESVIVNTETGEYVERAK